MAQIIYLTARLTQKETALLEVIKSKKALELATTRNKHAKAQAKKFKITTKQIQKREEEILKQKTTSLFGY